jgi:hypothetical protein
MRLMDTHIRQPFFSIGRKICAGARGNPSLRTNSYAVSPLSTILGLSGIRPSMAKPDSRAVDGWGVKSRYGIPLTLLHLKSSIF